MSQPTPYEFRDPEEILRHLLEKKAKLAEWFDKRLTLDEIVRCSVGPNTFRAFHNRLERPSLGFRSWASAELKDREITSELVATGSQSQYDEWVRKFSGRLSHTWQKRMGYAMPYGPGRKLPNLLLKTFILWNELTDVQRSKLLYYLHIPLDSYTLVGIRNCVSDLKILKTATMKFVKDETTYNHIQYAIRELAHKAGVPAIYFDVLAWNMRH
ncbi:MAG: hypothetical protein HYX79_05365 [Chloroflexi bacterium]|nr:hypothetical protein [Chloroflexota bacterium]